MTNTQPQAPAPAPQPTHAAKVKDTRKTSGLAITGLVLGIIGIVLSFIPIVNNAAAVLGVIGIIFAIIGIVKGGKKGKKKGRTMSIIAAVLCALAVIITLAMQQSASQAINKAENDAGISTLSDQGNGNTEDVKSVELQATATGKGTAMWDDGAGSSNSQDFNQKWSKKITGKDAKGMLSVDVTPDVMSDSDNQKVSCTILVNGKVKQHKEASGQSGSADCTIDLDN
jgi:hypothetical protein